MSPVFFQIKSVELFRRTVGTRIPYKFGISVMKEMPVIYLKVRVEPRQGAAQSGICAIGVPPYWFDKDTGIPMEAHTENLLSSVRAAIAAYQAQPFADLHRHHADVYPVVMKQCADRGLNELTSGFGLALLENALIDAVCKITGATFHKALASDAFGFGPELTRFIPAEPLAHIHVRHTLGLGDAVFTSDLQAPLHDGLPESLEQVIDAYGIRYFKIKINGDLAFSLQRLLDTARLLDDRNAPYFATLDGNEQFSGMEEFREFFAAFSENPKLRKFLDRTLWIEQPVKRQSALNTGDAGIIRDLNRKKPLIIDESDGSDDAFDEALRIGYAGTSAKNCKGALRTLHSFARVKAEAAKGNNLILSSEDLTNPPVVPLQQDLCVSAALGITHSERNGHHYIRGFQYMTAGEVEAAMAEFPSLYRRCPPGPPILDIREGRLSLGEINEFGFGTKSEPDWSDLTPVK